MKKEKRVYEVQADYDKGFSRGKCRRCGNEAAKGYAKLFSRSSYFRGEDEMEDCLCNICYKNPSNRFIVKGGKIVSKGD